MTPKTRLMLMTATMALSASMAVAAVTTTEIVQTYRDQGYSWIEVKQGITQIKVEAVRGTEKIEVVIDAETGAVLKQETEQASIGEQGRTGVEIRTRDEDFLDDDRQGDDVDDDGQDDGADDHGGDDDGGDDDDSDDDDDHGGDDHGGDDHGGDDDGDDDH